jgi:hypothetical protein
MVVIDDKVRFDAFAYASGGMNKPSLMVTGTVYEVNYAHKVFHVEYYIGDTKQRTSFKFCDIGSKVHVCGGF